MPLYVPDSGFQSVPSSGLKPWVIKQADYTAEAGDRLLVDTTLGSWTLTLPGQPVLGQSVEVVGINPLFPNPLSLDFASKLYEGVAGDWRIKTPNTASTLIYVSEPTGWIADTRNVIVPAFSISNLPGLLVYVDGETLNPGGISQWQDQSPNLNNLVQTTLSRQPTGILAALNGNPVARFAGGSQFLDFSRLTTIRTVYWVLKCASAGSGFLLGDSSAYDFHASGSGYFASGVASAGVINGALRRNGLAISTSTTPRSTDFDVLSLVTTANASGSSLSADRGNAYGNSSFIGDVAALAIYSQPHTPEQVKEMEAYLKNKFLP